MQPMLDDIELPQVQEITVHDQRTLAEHKPPGMAGSLLQNLGRRPTCLLLWGVTTGPQADGFIQQLDEKYRAGQPVSFIADIVEDANIEQVIIDNLQVQDLAGKPLRYGYILTLKEYIEPVEPEDISALNSGILDDALGAIDSITDALGFTDQLSQFIGQLNGLNEALQREGINAVTPSDT